MAKPEDFKFFHQELHFEAGMLEQFFLEGTLLGHPCHIPAESRARAGGLTRLSGV